MRKLQIASLQMDADPVPRDARLMRAANLIEAAAVRGAALVILPELFNTGYAYSQRNFALAETFDGETVRWLREQAGAHHIHLAATLLLRDGDEVYNAALLFAPDGRWWRYDKQYPYVWERVYFREGHGITVADTELGRLGMMICWDSAHADVWARYAGQVDALVVMSCPPAYDRLDVVFPDGERINTRDLGGLFRQIGENPVFGADLERRAAWMGVPVINSSGSGARFSTHVPAAFASMALYLMFRPRLWPRLREAQRMRVEGSFFRETKIVDAKGRVLDRVEHDADGLAFAEVALRDQPLKPNGAQPRTSVPTLLMWMLDYLSQPFMVPLYRSGVRRQWGQWMAPIEERTKAWLLVVLAASLLGWIAGRLAGP